VDVVNAAVRTFLAEPAVADPPARVWHDWVLLAGITVVAVLEAVLRTELAWPVMSLVVCLAVAPTLLWRRSRPLAMLSIAFAAGSALGIAGAVADTTTPPGLDTMAFVLVLPYALFRWASGRNIAIGSLVMLAAAAVGITTDPVTIGEAIGGFSVLLLSAAIGGVVRYRGTARGASWSRSSCASASSSPANSTTPSPTTCRPSSSRHRRAARSPPPIRRRPSTYWP
jgi:hypothetical protein